MEAVDEGMHLNNENQNQDVCKENAQVDTEYNFSGITKDERVYCIPIGFELYKSNSFLETVQAIWKK